MKKRILTFIVIGIVAMSCNSNWDMPLKVRFIQLCPDSTIFNVALETSTTPGILYSGLQYPNSSKFIQKTLSLGDQEPITFHLEKNGSKNALLVWGHSVSFTGTIIISGTIDSLQSCIINPSDRTYLGDTTSFNFVNAVVNSGLYDLKLGNQMLFQNRPYFSTDRQLDSCYVLTQTKTTDTLFVYKSGTSQIVANLPFAPYASNRNCTITISGLEGSTDFKKLRVSLFPNNK